MNNTDTLFVGKKYFNASDSVSKKYSVVFEDDGETGYFYAILREDNGDQPILDAMHIYNVRDVVDKNKSSEIKIFWSKDGLKSVLVINDYPHAVFDFESKRGYCRTNFPPPDNSWTKFSHEWTDDALKLFK